MKFQHYLRLMRPEVIRRIDFRQSAIRTAAERRDNIEKMRRVSFAPLNFSQYPCTLGSCSEACQRRDRNGHGEGGSLSGSHTNSGIF